jgi:hypothetical protein
MSINTPILTRQMWLHFMTVVLCKISLMPGNLSASSTWLLFQFEVIMSYPKFITDHYWR